MQQWNIYVPCSEHSTASVWLATHSALSAFAISADHKFSTTTKAAFKVSQDNTNYVTDKMKLRYMQDWIHGCPDVMVQHNLILP